VNTKPSIWIFDLDGTLADLRHRRHYVENGNRQWDAFHQACGEDALIKPVADVFRGLQDVGFSIWILSGRSDSVRRQTQSWLDHHHLYPDKLIMRRDGDYQPDTSLKEGWLLDIQKTHTVLGVFDDRKRLVDMWRSHGLVCFQVAEGNF